MSKSNYRTAAQINIEQRIKRLEGKLNTAATTATTITTDKLFDMFKTNLVKEHGLEGMVSDWSGVKFSYKGSLVAL